jgi:hypothetical protein
VLAEARMADTQSHQQRGKPKCSRISRKEGQDTESKARAMSTLSNRAGVHQAWRSLVDSWTNLKLSWITLPRRNAPWLARMDQFLQSRCKMDQGDGVVVLDRGCFRGFG